MCFGDAQRPELKGVSGRFVGECFFLLILIQCRVSGFVVRCELLRGFGVRSLNFRNFEILFLKGVQWWWSLDRYPGLRRRLGSLWLVEVPGLQRAQAR